MTREENIRAILDTCFSESKDELKEVALKSIMSLSDEAKPKWNCTANFVSEQLDRLRNMTDEEKWDFFIRFFSPSAEAVQRWIPVSERLPKEYTQYLVCFESGHCYVYWLNDSDWARGMAEKEGIIAWMPLPKPYRDESEVEE